MLAAIVFAWIFVVELMIVGLANSVSWHCWSLHYADEGRSLVKCAPYIVISFLRMTYEFWGYRNNGHVTYKQRNGGYWKGIGDWKVFHGRVP